MSGAPTVAALLAAVPGITGVEPWEVTGIILGGSLVAMCILYVVVRFARPGSER
jgi:hypothetical protein